MLSKLLVTIAKKHKNLMADRLRTIDLYVGQDIFLLTLEQFGPLSQRELKEKLMVEYATINKIAGRLQKHGEMIRVTGKGSQPLLNSIVNSLQN